MKHSHFCSIVGDGRMAIHFTKYLELRKIPYKQWSRKKNGNENPEIFLEGSNTVLLLIKDDAISPFLKKYPLLKKMNPIHFSGSLYLEEVPSIHPLMTFSHEIYELDKYQSIPFIHEKGKVSFSDLFPQLPNRSQAMDQSKKELYHSLCVLSGNFTTMLWQKAFGDFNNKLDLDSQLLIPYMEQIFENLKGDWRKALTGPFARHDEKTIEKNIKALEGDLYQNVYRSFANTVLTRGNL